MSDAITTRDAVVIERHFDAPVEVIWQMWIDRDEFSAWYGPDGASVRVVRWDVRVGGSRLICMTAQTPSGGVNMWFAGEFLDLIENQRLVYTEFVSNEDGKPATEPHTGMPNPHPATEVRVDLAEVDGGTQMVMTHRGVPAESPGAAGWRMAFDKLATHLGEPRPQPRR
jgi:uncharacterized protein YndB with AHSA1/START domain